MSFLDDALGAALGGVGLGLPLAHFWGDLNKRGKATPYQKTPPIGASDVGLLEELRNPLAEINKKRQAGLQGSLGRLGTRETASSRASGRVSGEYIPQELEIAGKRASRGIEDTLGGALGGASYDELLKQKEHEQNLALANEIGALSAPTLLEQILGGLSGGGKAGAQFYGLYNALGTQPKRRNTQFSSAPEDIYAIG